MVMLTFVFKDIANHLRQQNTNGANITTSSSHTMSIRLCFLEQRKDKEQGYRKAKAKEITLKAPNVHR